MVHLLLVLKPSIPFTHTDTISSLLCLFNKIWSKIICKEQKLCFTKVLISLEQKQRDNARIRYNRPLISTGDCSQDPWWSALESGSQPGQHPPLSDPTAGPALEASPCSCAPAYHWPDASHWPLTEACKLECAQPWVSAPTTKAPTAACELGSGHVLSLASTTLPTYT